MHIERKLFFLLKTAISVLKVWDNKISDMEKKLKDDFSGHIC